MIVQLCTLGEVDCFFFATMPRPYSCTIRERPLTINRACTHRISGSSCAVTASWWPWSSTFGGAAWVRA